MIFPPFPTDQGDRVCIDLDGTLSEPTWPLAEIGAILPHAEEMIKHYADMGVGIIIYTARPATHLAMIWNWLTENELDHYIYDVVCGKPLASLYIDDHAVNINDILKEEEE